MEQHLSSDACKIDFELHDVIELVKSKSMEEICQEYAIGELKTTTGTSSQVIMKENQTNESNAFLKLSRESFASREELQDSVKKIALEQGYVMVIKRSKPRYYVNIACDRGGKYRTTTPGDKRKRFTGTRLINFPFEIWGKKKGSIWIIEIKNLTYNHGPSEDMSGHPMCRRFFEDEMQTVRTLSKASSTPREILTALRQGNPSIQATAMTMYNARTKIKRENLWDRTMIEALFEELGEGGFIFDIERDENGHLTHLLFVHPSSMVLTKNFPHVFIMDCTYKTNKYNMPLLDIIGISSFNTSFYSCIVFLKKEEEEDYIWALERFKKIVGIGNAPTVIVTDRELALMNAIKFVFPWTKHLLCIWHIQKSMLAKCKKYFKENDNFEEFLSGWTNVIYSVDELSFYKEWDLLVEQYKEKPLAVKYIKDTWLPYKERFIFAWTEKYLHFGNHASSKAEGAHATLKKYLQVSTGNFLEVKGKVCLAIENQVKELKAKLQSEKIRTSHGFQVPLFYRLLGNVSKHALKQLLEQYELASSRKELEYCRGNF